MVPGCDEVVLWFMGTEQMLLEVVVVDPWYPEVVTWVVTVVVPFVPDGQVQELGGVASGSTVMVVVVVVVG